MTTPSSTYRLQIRPGFTLFDAADLVPYLAELGVGAVYCSPLLTSAEGSDHGYDTIDPTTIDEARGGEAGWAALVAACREHGLGIVVDIVPNHMGVRVPRSNVAWWDVLTHGPDSAYAAWFDIDWSQGPVLLPILGSADDVAAAHVEVEDGDPVLRCYDHVLPLAPDSWHPGDADADVLARQHYRLADWRDANASLNYRRFFSIVDLAGVRVDDPAVFDATHARVLRWIADGEVAGLRIDHPDGLRDPGAYLARLREEMPDGWIISEKIMAPGEELPDWAHDGTVGYDALREVTQVLTPPQTVGDWDRLWATLGGGVGTAQDAEDEGKREMARTQLVAEARRLAALVEQATPEGDDEAASAAVAEHEPREATVAALQEIAAEFRVYRTYLPFGVERLDEAVARAAAARPDLAPTIERVAVLLRDPSLEVAQRFQQLTGPVMAKGVEDTAFYRYNRLIPLNEVGGDPGHDAGSLAEFHEAMRRRQAGSPASMTTLTTHDTKRSEDVRAGMLALAEMPEAFEPFATHVVEECGLSDRGFAFALAQTLACGPVDVDRVTAWSVKALREAGLSSSWTDPDTEVESAVQRAIAGILDGTDERGRALWEELQARLVLGTLSNVLSQKAIQLMMPGVPDVYQGTEYVVDSLVDPDNRRDVDFDARRATVGIEDAGYDLAVAKQQLVRKALLLRRDRPELFGTYVALEADGPTADHLVAFDRGGALCVATRQPVALQRVGGWGETTLALPEGRWTNVVDQTSWEGTVRIADLLEALPCAILARG